MNEDALYAVYFSLASHCWLPGTLCAYLDVTYLAAFLGVHDAWTPGAARATVVW